MTFRPSFPKGSNKSDQQLQHSSCQKSSGHSVSRFGITNKPGHICPVTPFQHNKFVRPILHTITTEHRLERANQRPQF